VFVHANNRSRNRLRKRKPASRAPLHFKYASSSVTPRRKSTCNESAIAYNFRQRKARVQRIILDHPRWRSILLSLWRTRGSRRTNNIRLIIIRATSPPRKGQSSLSSMRASERSRITRRNLHKRSKRARGSRRRVR